MAKRKRKTVPRRSTRKRRLAVTIKPALKRVHKRAHASGVDETAFLLRSPANARELLAAIAEADAGKFEEHELIDG